jgi:heme oxygenase
MNSHGIATYRLDEVVTYAPPYSALLRENTRTAHQACEQAMNLAGALAGLCSYRELLRRMRAAYVLLAADSRFREAEMLLGRSGSITADLRRLAYDLEGEPAEPSLMNAQPLATEAQALGSQYVLAGSRLGSRVIVKQVMARLPAARATFFKGGDGDEILTWRAFQRRLDELGRSGQYDYVQVRQGAEQTFDVIAQALSG